MIVSVTSSDGKTVYTKVKAASYRQAEFTRDGLQQFAGQKTAAELLDDGYFISPECAARGAPCRSCRVAARRVA